MTIDALQPAQALAAQGNSGAARASLSADYESFLKLLTAQVSNQDPLEPMDSTTFVSQLAQLSQVEQSIQTNETLERIGGQLASFGALSEAGLIGRTVRASGDTFDLDPETGVDLAYTLKEDAAGVTARILHPDGTELRALDLGSRPAGTRETLHWDGRDFHGLPLPVGSYRIEIAAQDAAGERIGYETFTEGRVDSVVFRQGEALLQLSTGAELASDRVVEIR